MANLLLFGLFNPIQSAQAIFAAHDTPHLRALKAMQAAHPQGVLVVGGAQNYFGSILNGLGFRSVNHALVRPQLDRFRQIFPTLAEQDLQRIFNRAAIIQIGSRLPPDWRFVLKTPLVATENAVLVPVESFLPPLPVELSPRPSVAAPQRPGAATRMLTIMDREVELELFGPIRGLSGGTSVSLNTDPPAEAVIGSWRAPTSFDARRSGRSSTRCCSSASDSPAHFRMSVPMRPSWGGVRRSTIRSRETGNSLPSRRSAVPPARRRRRRRAPQRLTSSDPAAIGAAVERSARYSPPAARRAFAEATVFGSEIVRAMTR